MPIAVYAAIIGTLGLVVALLLYKRTLIKDSIEDEDRKVKKQDLIEKKFNIQMSLLLNRVLSSKETADTLVNIVKQNSQYREKAIERIETELTCIEDMTTFQRYTPQTSDKELLEETLERIKHIKV